MSGRSTQEIKITPEMVYAGVDVLLEHTTDLDDPFRAVREVLAASLPVPVVYVAQTEQELATD